MINFCKKYYYSIICCTMAIITIVISYLKIDKIDFYEYIILNCLCIFMIGFSIYTDLKKK